MSIDDDIALLARVPSLQVLGNAALRVLAIGADTQDVSRGDYLFRAGDGADAGYVVQRGSFRVCEHEDDAQAIIAGPGSLLGELALIVDLPRRSHARALDNASVIVIPRKLFQKVLESDPDAAVRLRDALAMRANQAAHDMISVRGKLSPL